MFRHALLVAAAAVCACAARSEGAVKTWDGGGGTLLWSNAANWDPDGIPGAADDVVIDAPGSITVAYLSLGTSIHSLTCAETLSIGISSLSIAAPSTIANLKYTNAGTLTGAGDVTVTGTATLNNSGVLAGTGHLIVAAGGTLTISGVFAIQKNIDNYGTGTWSGGNVFFAGGSNAAFNNYGTLNVPWSNTGSSLAMQASEGSGSGSFNNHGTINKTGAGSAGCTVCCGNEQVAFNNAGTVNVLDGMWLMLNGAHSGTFNLAVSGGTRLYVSGSSPVTFAETAQIIGPGNMKLAFANAAPCDFYCPLAMIGGLDLAGGTFGFHGSMTPTGAVSVIETQLNYVTFDGPECTLPQLTFGFGDPGFIAFNSRQSMVGTMFLYGAQLTGSGDVTITNSLQWGDSVSHGSGSMTGGGRTIVAPGATLQMPGVVNSLRKISRTLDNYGTATLSPSSTNQTVMLIDGGLIRNFGTWTDTISAPGGNPCKWQRTAGAASATFENHGTYTKAGSSELEFSASNGGVQVVNAGEITVTGSQLRLNGGGVNSGIMRADAPGMLRFAADYSYLPGSALTGTGIVRIELGVHDIRGEEISPASFQPLGGTVTIHSPITAGAVSIGGSVDLEADQIWSDAALFSGGTIDGPGDVELTGTASLAGTMRGTGATAIASTCAATVNGQPTLMRSLTNNGTITWTSNDWKFNGGELHNNGTLTSQPSAPNTCRFKAVGGANLVANDGTINKNNAGMLDFQVSGGSLQFDNHSVVNVNQGTLQIGCPTGGSGLLNVAASATCRLAADLAAGGIDLDGALWLGPGVICEVDGAFTAAPIAVVRMQFDAAHPGTLLDCRGATTLGGMFVGSFAPPPAPFSVVTVVRSDRSISGAFDGASLNPPGRLDYPPSLVTWTTFRLGDVDGDGDVGMDDLAAVINGWGTCPFVPVACPADLNADVIVNVDDLFIVINAWDPGT